MPLEKKMEILQRSRPRPSASHTDVKEKLGHKIRKNRREKGMDDTVVKEEEKKFELTKLDIERRERRKASNRKAAKKLREKKMKKHERFLQELEDTKRENQQLKLQLEILKAQNRAAVSFIQGHMSLCPSVETATIGDTSASLFMTPSNPATPATPATRAQSPYYADGDSLYACDGASGGGDLKSGSLSTQLATSQINDSYADLGALQLYIATGIKRERSTSLDQPACMTGGAATSQQFTCMVDGATHLQQPTCMADGAAQVQQPTCMAAGADGGAGDGGLILEDITDVGTSTPINLSQISPTIDNEPDVSKYVANLSFSQ